MTRNGQRGQCRQGGRTPEDAAQTADADGYGAEGTLIHNYKYMKKATQDVISSQIYFLFFLRGGVMGVCKSKHCSLLCSLNDLCFTGSNLLCVVFKCQCMSNRKQSLSIHIPAKPSDKLTATPTDSALRSEKTRVEGWAGCRVAFRFERVRDCVLDSRPNHHQTFPPPS